MLLDYMHTIIIYDALSQIMMMLIAYVGLIVGVFSTRYLCGTVRYARFFITLALFLVAMVLLVCTRHLILFALLWGVSSFLLTCLMMHTPGWRATRATVHLVRKNVMFSTACLVVGCFLLYISTGEFLIDRVVTHTTLSVSLYAGLFLLLVAGVAQSALVPFHRWLLSSLASPTPVSALMHAGLVNGGGFLLARFAPLYLQSPALLDVLFMVGIISTLAGTVWSCIHTDVKRSLACSTVGQMGFMFVQCGLGLFSAAIAHVVLHGLFKAYSFLSSSTVPSGRRQRFLLRVIPTCIAVLIGILSAYTFCVFSHTPLLVADTRLFLTLVAGIGGVQLSLPLLHRSPSFPYFSVPLIGSAYGALYGLSVYSIEHYLGVLHLMQPQPLGIVYIAGFALLVALWVACNFWSYAVPESLMRWYVMMVNASQPDPTTVTSCAQEYSWK